MSPTLLHKVRATPRYDALMELKTHWPLDLERVKPYDEYALVCRGPDAMSPAENALVPASSDFPSCQGRMYVRLPFPQVFRAESGLAPSDAKKAACKSCMLAGQ